MPKTHNFTQTQPQPHRHRNVTTQKTKTKCYPSEHPGNTYHKLFLSKITEIISSKRTSHLRNVRAL